jgi:hypothetical protein
LIGLANLIPHPFENILGQLSEDWGSQHPNHRLNLRQGLKHFLEQQGERASSDFDDLEKRPINAAWSLSISHTDGLGGFVALRSPDRIGFDIEVPSRIQPNLIQRLSSPTELAAAPQLRLLWTAKEAVFKSLPSSIQPKVMSHIQIRDWARDHRKSGPGLEYENAYSFSAYLKRDTRNTSGYILVTGQGINIDFLTFQVGIFIFKGFSP